MTQKQPKTSGLSWMTQHLPPINFSSNPDGGTDAHWQETGKPVEVDDLLEKGLVKKTTSEKCWCGGRASWSVDQRWVCDESTFHDPFSDGRPNEIKKLYVAGPMTGYPENNYPLFNRVAGELRKVGYEVVNPAEFGADGGHYVDLLRKDLIGLLECDGVAYLDRWWESTGARNEIQVAGVLWMPVRDWGVWVAMKMLPGFPGLPTL